MSKDTVVKLIGNYSNEKKIFRCEDTFWYFLIYLLIYVLSYMMSLSGVSLSEIMELEK